MPEQTACGSWCAVCYRSVSANAFMAIFSGEDIVLNYQRPDNEHLGIDWGTHLGRTRPHIYTRSGKRDLTS